jgi:putative ABC transport system permease protein
MTSVAIKGLLGRKLRAILTAISIVLGVAMVSGSFVLTDSIQGAFHTLFSSSYSNTDAVVTGKKLVDYSNSGNATVSASLLTQIRAQPDVERAAGVINDMSGGSLSAKLYDKHGKIITGNGNPTMGVGIDPDAGSFNPMHLTEGRWAAASGEVVIDKNAAGKYGFSVGDTTKVAVDAGVFPVRIVGIARYGDVDSLGGATFAVFDTHTAQKLFKLGDSFTSISVQAKDGVEASQLVSQLRQLDHRRAADARARDAADARCLAAPGAALGRPRGVRDRPLRVGRRSRRRRRDREGPELAVRRARDGAARGRAAGGDTHDRRAAARRDRPHRRRRPRAGGAGDARARDLGCP